MKKRLLFLSLILLISLSLIVYMTKFKTQQTIFKQSQRNYQEIQRGTSINHSRPWGAFSHTFKIPIGFTYEFLGVSFDSLNLETTARLVFDKEHLFFADAFTEISLQDAGFNTEDSRSPITYKNEESPSGKILIIQFKNASLKNAPLSSINFQIRLYQNSNNFELHMGPSTINNLAKAFSKGPYCGINKVIHFAPINYDYLLAIYGDPTKPQTISDSGKDLNSQQIKLNGPPKSGTVYTLKTSLPK